VHQNSQVNHIKFSVIEITSKTHWKLNEIKPQHIPSEFSDACFDCAELGSAIWHLEEAQPHLLPQAGVACWFIYDGTERWVLKLLNPCDDLCNIFFYYNIFIQGDIFSITVLIYGPVIYKWNALYSDWLLDKVID